MAEKVDVLFIHPGDRKQIYQALGDEFCAIEPPVFAGLFATYLRRKGRSAAIYDTPAMGATAAEAARIATEDYAPTLIVIPVYGNQPSASTQNMGSTGKIARLIKEANPAARILLTGTHLAALPRRTMEEEAVDFVCDGEGPATILKVLDALQAKATSFADIPSLWWRDDGRIVPPASREALVADLDNEMPGIAWDLLPMDRYRAHNWHCFSDIGNRSPYAAIHTSLGCPYHCSFCCINAPFGKSAYRMWSPESVMRELDFLAETYGVVNVKFVDEMFVLNKRHVLGICEELAKRDYKLNIWAYARVDTVRDEFLDAMRKAGISWVCLGIESASQHVRDGADKVYGNDDIIDVVRRIQSAGLNVLGNYIFGLPDDTPERMRQTLDLALELNCEFANFYVAMAYPGSRLYETAAAEGKRLPQSWHQFSQHAFDTLPLANAALSSAEIVAARDAAWLEYFSHPAYLDLVNRKFGAHVVDHIRRMAAVPLPRQGETCGGAAR